MATKRVTAEELLDTNPPTAAETVVRLIEVKLHVGYAFNPTKGQRFSNASTCFVKSASKL